MAALLRDEDIEDGFINSMCAAVLVCTYNRTIFKKKMILWLMFSRKCFISNLFQIGNRFALTAAHCLYDEDFEEVMQSFIVVFIFRCASIS